MLIGIIDLILLVILLAFFCSKLLSRRVFFCPAKAPMYVIGVVVLLRPPLVEALIAGSFGVEQIIAAAIMVVAAGTLLWFTRRLPQMFTTYNAEREAVLEGLRQALDGRRIEFEEKPPGTGETFKLGGLATVKPYHGWQFVLPEREAVLLVGGLHSVKSTTIGLVGRRDDPEIAAVFADYKKLMSEQRLEKVPPDSIALIVTASLMFLVAAAMLATLLLTAS